MTDPTTPDPASSQPSTSEAQDVHGEPVHVQLPAPWLNVPEPLAPPPAPSNRKRNQLIAAGVVAVVAVVVVVLLVTGVGGSDPTKPTLPQSFAGYSRLDNASSERVEGAMRGFLSGAGAGSANDESTIASYSKSDTASVIALVVPTNGSAVDNHDPTTVVEKFLSVVPAPEKFPATTQDGALECGSVTYGTVAETLCAFSDRKFSGVVTSVQPALDPSAAAEVTRELRRQVK